MGMLILYSLRVWNLNFSGGDVERSRIATVGTVPVRYEKEATVARNGGVVCKRFFILSSRGTQRPGTSVP